MTMRDIEARAIVYLKVIDIDNSAMLFSCFTGNKLVGL